MDDSYFNVVKNSFPHIATKLLSLKDNKLEYEKYLEHLIDTCNQTSSRKGFSDEVSHSLFMLLSESYGYEIQPQVQPQAPIEEVDIWAKHLRR